MKRKNIWIPALLFALSLTAGCSKPEKQFVVEGTIANAEGKMLYLEEVGTGNLVSLDSVKLDSEGKFKFSYDGTYYPMFYRLKLDGQVIPFAADSVTHLVIKASAANFFDGYELIEADQTNRQIQDINFRRYHTDCKIDSLITLYNNGMITPDSLTKMVRDITDKFKNVLTRSYIYVDPKSAASYYALFQKKDGVMYFDDTNKSDSRAFAAVATAFDTFYPSAPYAPFLKDIALKSIATTRQRDALAKQLINLEHAEPVPFPEIRLKDAQRKDMSLTDVASRHKRVLLSITAYSADWSPELVQMMRNVYNQREAHDLEIYEVSEDRDIYFWRNASRTLPWVCVYDNDNSVIRLYNVEAIPAFFLIENGTLKAIKSPKEALL